MKINLLDPGLSTLAGHHFDLDLRLFRVMERRGHEVVVHGFVDPDASLEQAASAAGITLRKTFRMHPYRPAFQEHPPHDAYSLMEKTSAEDLAQVGDADLWFWPTLTPWQLAAGLLAGTTTQQIGGTWWVPGFSSAVGADSWAASCARLQQNPEPFLIGAYDELLIDASARGSNGASIHCLPCPHDGAPNHRQTDMPKVIGFFGHQRVNRGINLIPQLVDELLQRGFDVVVQDSSGKIRGKQNTDRLRVLKFIDDFPAEIARCDLVLWPSRAESYQSNWSGVVSETLATGVPIVVPAGCLPARLVARYGAGTFFHDFSAAAILGAVDEAVARYPALKAAARAAATDWRARNGTEHLVDWLEKITGVRS